LTEVLDRLGAVLKPEPDMNAAHQVAVCIDP
jgi:hypothetical protein